MPHPLYHNLNVTSYLLVSLFSTKPLLIKTYFKRSASEPNFRPSRFVQVLNLCDRNAYCTDCIEACVHGNVLISSRTASAIE